MGDVKAAELETLRDQMETLFLTVFDCERQWQVDDRFDLILRLAGGQ